MDAAPSLAGNVRVVVRRTEHWLLRWDRGANPLRIGFVVETRAGEADTWTLVTSTEGASLKITPPEPVGRSLWRVAATRAGQRGPWSAAVEARWPTSGG